MREKRKGYLKIHVAVDVVTKQAVSLEVSHDGEKFVPLVRQAQKKAKVAKVLGDGAYDRGSNFGFLASQGIGAGIQVREGSYPRGKGARGEVVRAYLADPKGWKQKVGDGRRWMAETFFWGLKRLFGEAVQAKRFEWVYNLLIGLAVGLGSP